MASFDGQTFRELLASDMWGAEADYELGNTDYHIPGSDDNVNISVGRLTRTVEVPFSDTASVKTALISKIGTTGSLVYGGGTFTGKCVGVVGVKPHSTLDKWRGRIRVKIG